MKMTTYVRGVVVSTVVFGSLLAMLYCANAIPDHKHVLGSLSFSTSRASQLCVIVRGLKELKEGDTNMVNVAFEQCQNSTGNNFVQVAEELVGWAASHAAEISTIREAVNRASCDMGKGRTLWRFEGISRMASISANLSQQSMSFHKISSYFQELVTLALTAESRLARAEQLYGECLCRQDPSRKLVPWGAWCARKQLDPEKRERSCNYRLADYLANNVLNGCSVADIGAGAGTYSKYILSRAYGKPKSMIPFDGGIGVNKVTQGFVNYANLAKPLRLRVDAPVFDWVMSLEVAEHIPKEAETTFINNLVRHAAKGIIVSWAVPGQGGVGHVNERTHAYVVRRFTQLGFTFDAIETNIARKASKRMSKLRHFSRTLHVFRRESHSLGNEQLLWDPQNERLVHNQSILS